MLLAIFTFLVVNLLIWAAAMVKVKHIRKRMELSNELEQYCNAQYLNMLANNHSSVIQEYNEKFLPDSEEKETLRRYQKLLKKIRKKKILPCEIHPPEIHPPEIHPPEIHPPEIHPPENPVIDGLRRRIIK